jgi:hypothetical protein
MKRLLEEADPMLGVLTALVASAEPYQSSPFAKRHVQSRLTRALEAGRTVAARRVLRPALLAFGGLLVAASAAAAGYTLLASSKKPEPVAPLASVAPSGDDAHADGKALHVAAPALPAPDEPAPAVELPSAKRVDKPRAGEDPSLVAEAVRALRKQGDAARAQALLDQYLRANPHGALAEDALALSIEAAAARKDPRAADYARRYLARYPNGRFHGVAERALSR